MIKTKKKIREKSFYWLFVYKKKIAVNKDKLHCLFEHSGEDKNPNSEIITVKFSLCSRC